MQKTSIISVASLAALALLSTAAAAGEGDKTEPADNSAVVSVNSNSEAGNPAADEADTRLVVPENTQTNAVPDETASNRATIEGRLTGAAAAGVGTATP
jgi:hypothetical protein